jgi:enoyl-CoA hydratase/carnithine racemase
VTRTHRRLRPPSILSTFRRAAISLRRPQQNASPDDSSGRTTEVHVHRHPDGVLELRLVGGALRNALGRSTIERIESLVSTPPIGTRVVVLTAEEPDFCAGYDLREAARGDAEQLIANGVNFAPLKTSGVPIIAALHGNVIGGGLELALAADVRLATPNTKLALPAGRLGLVYSEEGVRLLVNEVGESRARAMLLAGTALAAEEAQLAGIITEVVVADRLQDRALELASTIASWSELATSGNRRVLDVVVGRASVDTAALRLASFQTGGVLAASIERFASGQSDAVAEEPRSRVPSVVRWKTAVRAGSGRIGEAAARASWLIGMRAGDRLHRVRN